MALFHERLRLGTYPTPVRELTFAAQGDDAPARLFVKCDDATSSVYGGNKVRKLEYVLAHARERKKTRLLTIGAAGSHHVLATALHGRAHGFQVHAVLVPQPWTAHAEKNLRVGLANGLTAEAAWEPSMYLRVLAAMDANTEFISLGGSSVLGSLGYVDAAEELSLQIAKRATIEPDWIVVALGSGGTVAGLLVGLEKAGLRSKVLAVAIAKPVPIVKALGEWLTKRVARACDVDPERALARLEVDTVSVGAGYGHETPAGKRALELGAIEHVKVDPTYTAKALASALDRARAHPDEAVMFWNTLSSVALPDADTLNEPLPAELRALFRGAP